jgi:hypothetical protein
MHSLDVDVLVSLERGRETIVRSIQVLVQYVAKVTVVANAPMNMSVTASASWSANLSSRGQDGKYGKHAISLAVPMVAWQFRSLKICSLDHYL